MTREPTIVERDEQPYISITTSVPMRQLGELVPPLMPEVFGWLAARGIEPAGPPFWKYNVIDMAGDIELEVCVPTAEAIPNAEADRVQAYVLPGGKYALYHHVGHPDTLERATGELLDWAESEGLAWDTVHTDGEERWVARLEEYLNSPDDQPDMDKWETNLIFRLAQ